jgi:hypothetical protein
LRGCLRWRKHPESTKPRTHAQYILIYLRVV